MSEITIDDVFEELRAQRKEIRSLRRELRKQSRNELPRLQDFADELGLGRTTMYEKLGRRGIPVRDSHGFPKEEGDRSAAHVSRTEWEEGERVDTRTVRRKAGFYEDATRPVD
jgi:hypothetical protein